MLQYIHPYTDACVHAHECLYIYIIKATMQAVLLFATCKGKWQMKPHPADKRMAWRSNALCIPCPSIIHFEMAQSTSLRARESPRQVPAIRQADSSAMECCFSAFCCSCVSASGFTVAPLAFESCCKHSETSHSVFTVEGTRPGRR